MAKNDAGAPRPNTSYRVQRPIKPPRPPLLSDAVEHPPVEVPNPPIHHLPIYWPVVAGTILVCGLALGALIIWLRHWTSPLPGEPQMRGTPPPLAARPSNPLPAVQPDNPPPAPAEPHTPPVQRPPIAPPPVIVPSLPATTLSASLPSAGRAIPAQHPAPPPEPTLSEQLHRIPEIDLPGVADLRSALITHASTPKEKLIPGSKRDPIQEAHLARLLTQVLHQATEAGLPVQTGASSLLTPRAAETLGRGTADLHWSARWAMISGQGSFMTALFKRDATGQISLLDRKTGRTLMTAPGLPRSELRPLTDLRTLFEVTWPGEKVTQSVNVVPVLTQVLQVEDTDYRRLLVEELGRIPGPESSKALVARALYDPDAAIRKAAAAELKKRPLRECESGLLEGLRYVWPPVADHAAEALIELHELTTVPKLVALLDLGDPRFPFRSKPTGKLQVQELVRINHLRNCCLCHPPSFSHTDWVPGRVMEPGVPLPREYYSRPTGAFVRADITYLRPDFSTMMTVEKAKPWPEQQRYDFLVRIRLATEAEIARGQKAPSTASYPQREAILRVLRELTGKELGSSTAAWKSYAEDLQTPEKPRND